MIPSREDKRAFAEYVSRVMDGWANGRVVESSYAGADKWERHDTPPWNWRGYDYRLAPEPPSVTPWTFETVPVGTLVRYKHTGNRWMITGVVNDGVYIGAVKLTFSDVTSLYEQLNGEPCGVKAEAVGVRWFLYLEDLLYKQSADGSLVGRFIDREDEFSTQHVSTDWLAANAQEITAAEAEALLKGVK